MIEWLTGGGLDTRPLLGHLTAKFGEIYELESSAPTAGNPGGG
jgi:hypothetical protein